MDVGYRREACILNRARHQPEVERRFEQDVCPMGHFRVRRGVMLPVARRLEDRPDLAHFEERKMSNTNQNTDKTA